MSIDTGHHSPTMVDLLDRILDRGAYLKADVIVTVAGIPLLGVSLQALLGGVETLLAYGVFRDWDTAIRAEQQAAPRERVESPVALLGADSAGKNIWIRATLAVTGDRLTVSDTGGQPRVDLALSDLRQALVVGDQPGSAEASGRVLLQSEGASVSVHVYHLRSILNALVARGVRMSTTGG